jgi:uncharacterized membrane protein
MTDIETVRAAPMQGLVAWTHVIYGLHAFTVITGMMTPVLVVTAFVTGWPSIIAVILNYVKVSETRGTWLESHFRWQIRTFWFALLWGVIAGLLFLTFVGIPFAFGMIVLAGLWVCYRVARGWLCLVREKPMPR